MRPDGVSRQEDHLEEWGGGGTIRDRLSYLKKNVLRNLKRKKLHEKAWGRLKYQTQRTEPEIKVRARLTQSKERTIQAPPYAVTNSRGSQKDAEGRNHPHLHNCCFTDGQGFEQEFLRKVWRKLIPRHRPTSSRERTGFETLCGRKAAQPHCKQSARRHSCKNDTVERSEKNGGKSRGLL